MGTKIVNKINMIIIMAGFFYVLYYYKAIPFIIKERHFIVQFYMSLALAGLLLEVALRQIMSMKRITIDLFYHAGILFPMMAVMVFGFFGMPGGWILILAWSIFLLVNIIYRFIQDSKGERVI